jgi:non-ribosomal peptide synthetase component F
MANLLSGVSLPMVIICPDQSDVAELAANFPKHRVIGATELADGEDWSLSHVDDNSVAYLLFTSGSTGQPKGRDGFSTKLSRNEGVRMRVCKGPVIGHAVYCTG